jgi:hypothetical protein
VPTRRQFLAGGTASGLVLALGAVGLGLRAGTLRSPARPLAVLDERTFSVVAALADRLVPAHGGFPSPSEIGVAHLVDDLLARAHPGDRRDVERMLRAIENAAVGLVLDGSSRPFTTCTPAEQDRILERWRTSRLPLRRTVYKALNGLVGAAYYGSPEVWAAMGYPGPPPLGARAAR